MKRCILISIPLLTGLAFAEEGEAEKQTAFQDLYEHPNKGKEAFKFVLDPFTLAINLRTQVQAALYVQDDALVENNDPATTEGFRLRRARVGFYGEYKKVLGLNVELDLYDKEASGNTLSAANILYKPFPQLNIAVGIAPMPFLRGAMTSSAKLQMIERSMTATLLTPGSQLGSAILGRALKGRLEYAVGVFNGSSGYFTRGDVGKGLLYAARVQLAPLGPVDMGESDYNYSRFGFAIGVDYYYNHDSSVQTHAVSSDLAIKWRGFSFIGEIGFDQRRPEDSPTVSTTLPTKTRRLGFYVQTGYFIVRKILELALRYEWLDDQMDISDAGDLWFLTGGLNLFLLDGYLKIQLNYVHKDERGVPELHNDCLFTQFQVNL